MEMLECTAGAVGVSTMRVAAAFARPVAQATGNHLLLPTVRTHSLAGVGLYEVQGIGQGLGRSDDRQQGRHQGHRPHLLSDPSGTTT